MNLKKTVFVLVSVLFLDIAINLGLNANLVTLQRNYLDLEVKITQLSSDNQKLEKNLADLSSLSRINELATAMGLQSDQKSIVLVSRGQFAKR